MKTDVQAPPSVAPQSSWAPQPHDPDASEYTWTEGDGSGSSDVPFQSCRKHLHHCRSALAEATSDSAKNNSTWYYYQNLYNY